jgi:hypothetical protein
MTYKYRLRPKNSDEVVFYKPLANSLTLNSYVEAKKKSEPLRQKNQKIIPSTRQRRLQTCAQDSTPNTQQSARQEHPTDQA